MQKYCPLSALSLVKYLLIPVIFTDKTANVKKSGIKQTPKFLNHISRQPRQVRFTAAVTLVHTQHIVAVPHMVLAKEIYFKV